MPTFEIDPLIAAAVVVATACTDAVYVLFTNAVVRRRRMPAATTWSSVWYLLSSFAVINYTHHWSYVIFAALGSFIGAYITITFLHPGPSYPTQPPGSSPA
jgi:drug/metabolite transporter (DMT)-like permease